RDLTVTGVQTCALPICAFSYSVSHDLRAPLRAIDGFSRMLVEDHAGALPPEGHRYLGLVRKNTQNMSRLIDGLLTFARLGQQRQIGRASCRERVETAEG